MTTKTISLRYQGYWRGQAVQGIPANAGVYSVYAARDNPQANTVTLENLIYIGESENVHDRIANHEKWATWRRYLRPVQELCFNFAPVTADRVRAEAALIFHHKPPANTEYVNVFPFDTTTIRTSGANALLSDYFTVHRTVGSAARAGLLSY